MVKILVTGAGGQLGSELKKIAAMVSGSYHWLFTDVAEMDVGDRWQVDAFFRRENPDVVVNCAAWTDVDGAESHREEVFSINAEGVRTLAMAARESGATLIHISTDFVFDGDRSEPYREDAVAKPLNVYGESKLAGERAVVESGCNGVVVRTSWLYSPYGRNFVKSILAAAHRGGDLKVVDDQWGNPTAADGLAAAIVAMIPQLLSKPRKADVYHYSDGGVTSRYGFAQEIIRQAGLVNKVIPIHSSEYPRAVSRPKYSALESAKIGRDFGIVPRRWQDALAKVLAKIDINK